MESLVSWGSFVGGSAPSEPLPATVAWLIYLAAVGVSCTVVWWVNRIVSVEPDDGPTTRQLQEAA